MSKSTDHLRWSHVKPMLLRHGYNYPVAEIDLIETRINDLVRVRNEAIQRTIQMMINRHRSGVEHFEFRRCHAKKLDTLDVTTEFWLT